MFGGVTHTQDAAFEAGALSCLHHSHSVVVCSQRVLSHFETVKIKFKYLHTPSRDTNG